MAQFSKSILASLLVTAAFNFNAYAEPVQVANDAGVSKASRLSLQDNLRGAIVYGRLDKARDLIEQGANPFAYHMLADAVNSGREDVMAFMLSLETETQKFSPDELNGAMISAELWGFKNGKASPAVMFLLKERGDQIKQSYKDSFLNIAALRGDVEAIKETKARGGDILFGNSAALRTAAEAGKLPVVQYLMENGANALAEGDCFCGGKTALMEAASHGHVDVLKYMVQEKKVSVNEKDRDGVLYSPALIRAFWGGSAEAADFLLSNGAEFKAIEVRSEILLGAIEAKKWDLVRVGLSHGMDVTYAYRKAQQKDRYAEQFKQLQVIMAEMKIPEPKPVAAPTAAPAP